MQIRSAYLNKVDRQLIVERIATLQMPESVARFAKNSMESKHSTRICLEGTHINRHLVRCGIPDPENRPKETTLVLSRPREGIKWSEKSKSRRAEEVEKIKEKQKEQEDYSVTAKVEAENLREKIESIDHIRNRREARDHQMCLIGLEAKADTERKEVANRRRKSTSPARRSATNEAKKVKQRTRWEKACKEIKEERLDIVGEATDTA
ncbi:unnamed protein product [Strongylus vulgaris]|uniref:Uncharacterized protein n=1 Tax=Strongylus vulgaris TaxID=40348 RepID=A0A3P7I3L5_STRVU|nr:unnamed protein product [Strongylus vulgaris]